MSRLAGAPTSSSGCTPDRRSWRLPDRNPQALTTIDFRDVLVILGPAIVLTVWGLLVLLVDLALAPAR